MFSYKISTILHMEGVIFPVLRGSDQAIYAVQFGCSARNWHYAAWGYSNMGFATLNVRHVREIYSSMLCHCIRGQFPALKWLRRLLPRFACMFKSAESVRSSV